MVGKQISHYRIVEKLGAGGMGEVYRAHDDFLDRDVALKVLPADTFADPAARARLLREARTASQLNHPNVCTIHEVGEVDGQAYIAMEFVEGKLLSAMVSDQALPVEAVLRYGSQIANALAHAHERQIVHRDLKSANVVITADGRAKVLDFGLAKRFSENELDDVTRSQASLTTPGTLVGTLAYMAPEQLRGQPADSRSDIWALGVVLYEMAARVRPFQGKTGYELTSAILNQPSPPLRASVPLPLKAVIERCLDKEPGQRYQHAGEVRAALEAIQTGTAAPWAGWGHALSRRRWLALTAALTAVVAVAALLVALDVAGLRTRLFGGAPQIQSLAVLPLANLSGDPAQDYFTEGMHEALITELAKLGGFQRVIARSSVMQYQKTNKPLPQIARELGVDAIVTGSVLRSGDRVRVTAQLTRGATQDNLWADHYERELRDVLSLQNEIVAAMTRGIKLKLTAQEEQRLAIARPVNPEAYEAYLKGLHHWYSLTPAELDTALKYFEVALQKDPNYALAYTGIASVWEAREQMGFLASSVAAPKVRAAALKALELDSSVAEAHFWLASVKGWYDWDWPGAEAEFQRAIQLNPNYPDARAAYSHFLNCMSRPQEAMAQIQRALELDPFNPFLKAFYGVDLIFVRRYDDAIVQFRSALKSVPDSPLAHNGLHSALHDNRMYAEALVQLKAYAAAVGYREVVEALARPGASGGYRETMRRAADALAARARTAYVTRLDLATWYLWAGENDRALQWIEKGLQDVDPNMPYINSPDFDSLRDDPRFQALLHRMNLPPAVPPPK